MLILMVGAEGFEPPTLCSQSRCATRLRYAPTLEIVSQTDAGTIASAIHTCRMNQTASDTIRMIGIMKIANSAVAMQPRKT